MPPQRYTTDNLSGSVSDSDEAPEQVSLATTRSAAKSLDREASHHAKRDAQLRKEKNRQRDQRLKERAAALKQAEEDEAGQDAELQEDVSEEEEAQEPAPVASTSKKTYLDPAMFASAASFYEPEKQAAPGQGKMAAKRAARAEKRARAEAAAERATEIREGGSRSVGDVTIQHLPNSSHKAHSLASTALPSHTSANKFITNRLYSKKRQLAVLDAGKPRTTEQSDRKRKKKGGMSEESKMLLGLGMDDGSREKEAAEEKDRNRKRTLLLQAEGKRRAATLARPLASAKARGRPAANFAVSTRTR